MGGNVSELHSRDGTAVVVSGVSDVPGGAALGSLTSTWRRAGATRCR